MSSIQSELSSTATVTEKSISTFLAIPLEIRLQIYGYVLQSHPIHHAHLAPSSAPTSFSRMNTEEFYTTMLRPNGLSLPSMTVLNTVPVSASNATSTVPVGERIGTRHTLISISISPDASFSVHEQLLPASASGGTGRGRGRGGMQGKIPTGLLASCSQIYHEAYLLPWEKNKFTFVNWFWSGVYAARQFTRSLPRWQSESIRLVGVEVLRRDLWVGELGGGASSTGGFGGKEGKGVTDWCELCGLWSGVWRLKLAIKGSIVIEKAKAAPLSATTPIPQSVSDPSPDDIISNGVGKGKQSTAQEDTTILDVDRQWISHGLSSLRNLRTIEIEIEDEDVPRARKIAFCAELSRFLTGVQVIFVEEFAIKREREEVSNRDFVWYGGEPGDDNIWG
jgi:hypothetical protein